MAKTLKQLHKEINNEILGSIKIIHEFVTRWSLMTKEGHEHGEMDDYYFQRTGDMRTRIEIEIRKIYKYLMEQEAIDAHIKKLNEQMEREFNY